MKKALFCGLLALSLLGCNNSVTAPDTVYGDTVEYTGTLDPPTNGFSMVSLPDLKREGKIQVFTRGSAYSPWIVPVYYVDWTAEQAQVVIAVTSSNYEYRIIVDP